MYMPACMFSHWNTFKICIPALHKFLHVWSVHITESVVTIFFWQKSDEGFKLELPHEDQPHKDACVVASIRNQGTKTCGPLLLPKTHIREAAEALKLAGIMAVLDGRTDDQDKLREREVLTNKSIGDWLLNHNDQDYQLTGQVLNVLRGMVDLWDRSGLNNPTRDAYAAETMDLLEAVIGNGLRLASGPGGKTFCTPSNLLFVLGANLSSQNAFLIIFPDEPLKERNVGTYCCEGFFSTLVVTNHGQKPTGEQCVSVMRNTVTVTVTVNLLKRAREMTED